MFNIFADVAVDFNPFRRDMQQAEREATRSAQTIEKGYSKLGGMFSKLGKSIGSMFSGMAMGAGMAAFNGMLSGVGKITSGISDALFGLNNAAEQAQAKINAFTKDSKVTADILAQVRAEASKTPFAFQEMANATAALQPVAKASGVAWMDLLKNAEILAASNPLEGLEGASFSLREAMTGDFTSIIERFNLSRTTINKLKEEGVPNIEIVRRAMQEMGFDQDLVGQMALTMEGRWSTLLDTMDNFKIALTKPTFDFLKTVLGDTQTYLDGNTEKWTALAETAGTKFAAALATGYSAIKRTIEAIRLFRDAAEGTTTTVTRLGKGDWADRLAGRIGQVRQVIFDVRDGFDQLRTALMEGDFAGGGPFSEDAPLVVGLLRINELVDSAKEKLGGLGDRANAGAAKAGVKLPSADQLGIAGAAGAAGLGVAALLPMLGTFAPMLSGIASVVPMLGAALGALITPVGLLAAGVAILGVAWVNNWGDIQGKTAEAIATIQPLIQQFGGYLSATLLPIWEDVSARARLAWDQIQAAVGTGVAAVMPLFTRFGDYFTNDLAPRLMALGDTIGPALRSMAETASGAFTAIVPYVQLFVGAVVNLGATLIPIFQRVGAAILDDLGPAIGAVVDWATNTIPLIASAFRGVMAVVVPVVQTILSVVTTVLGGVASFITSHSETITSVLLGAWNIIKGGVEVAWSLVSGIITTGLKLLSGDWSGAWQSIQDTLRNVWAGMQTQLSGAWQLLSGVVSLGVEALKTVWGNAWTWVSDKLTQVTGTIRTTVDTWIDGVKTKIDTVASGIKSAIMTPFESARDAIGGVMESFRDKLLGPLRSARDGMQSFVNGITSAISGIAGGLGIKIEITAPQLPGFAKGVNDWRGGLAWVGEEGPEIMYVPQHATIIPAPQSKALASVGALPGFAGGLNIPGLGGLMDFFGKAPEKIIEMALSAAGVQVPQLPGLLSGGGPALMGKVKDWLVGKVKEWISTALPVSGESMQAMINAAESAIGTPYLWGGGHGATSAGPWDCSGFVRYILDVGGISNPGGIVTDFYNWMTKTGGPSGILGIGVNNPFDDPTMQHVGIRLMGNTYESGGPFGGVGKNGTSFQEWGVPPGWEKAKGNEFVEDRTWANVLAGHAGQWGGTEPPGAASLADYLKRHPEKLLGGGIQNLAEALPRRGWSIFGNGGVIDEPIIGVGQDSGIQYLLGELGKEVVIPQNMLPQIVAYLAEVMMTGKASNATLAGLPLELRAAIENAAGRHMVEARTRRVNVSGSAATKPYTPQYDSGARSPSGSFLPVTATLQRSAAEQIQTARTTGRFEGGVLMEDDPRIVAALAEYARGKQVASSSGSARTPSGGFLPSTVKRSAAEQIQTARTTGNFVGGELQEDDPRILAALAEYKKGQGVTSNSGSARTPSGGFLPPTPNVPSQSDRTVGGGTSGAGAGGWPKEVRFVAELHHILPSGEAIVERVIDEHVAAERLTEEVLRIGAKALRPVT